MGMLVAKKFELMRCEVDEDQDSARPQHPSRFGNDRCRSVGIMQHLVNHHGIERGIRQGQVVHVTEPDLPVLETSAIEVDPGDGQHLARLVDAERAFDPRDLLDIGTGTGRMLEILAPR